MKPVMIQYEHGCTARKCRARRCGNDCGQLEHTRPAELPAECLTHDLVTSYVEGSWCGPGLVTLLVAALRQPKTDGKEDTGGTASNLPESRPPGWDADASALLADIYDRGIAGTDQDILEDWRRQARNVLGFAVPSIALPGATCVVCKEPSLRVARDAAGDVWCSNLMCHDSDVHPYCTDRLGYPLELGYEAAACRRTDRSLTHSTRWRRDSWGSVLRQMEAVIAERGELATC